MATSTSIDVIPPLDDTCTGEPVIDQGFEHIVVQLQPSGAVNVITNFQGVTGTDFLATYSISDESKSYVLLPNSTYDEYLKIIRQGETGFLPDDLFEHTHFAFDGLNFTFSQTTVCR